MAPRDNVQSALPEFATPLPAMTDDPGANTTCNETSHTSTPGFDLPSAGAGSLENARIVGLGEATHGTRECFQQKARLIQHLVADAGFQTVAFEADAAAATALDAFVRGAETEASAALATLGMWQWQTERVGDLLRWLRTFNAGRSATDQVRVRGVDLSTPAAPASPLRTFFERVDPAVTEKESFQTVADATVPENEGERERVLDTVAAAATSLAERLERNREWYEAATSVAEWVEARQFCRVVEQAAAWARVRHEQPGPHPAGMAARDRFMAENALWALEQDTGAGVALWAHDGHIQRGTFDDGTLWSGTTTMGERLARELGEDYRPVGFDFARGSFRAVGAESGEIETFTVGDPMERSATAAFATVDDAPFLLDLAAAAEDSRLDSWLDEEQRTRYVGSVYDPEGGDDAVYARTTLPASFDYLLFVPESTPTRPLGNV